LSRDLSNDAIRRGQLLAELGDEIRTSQNRTERFDGAVCEMLGINRTDNTAIDILDRRGRLTAGELARELGLTTGAVTALVDRMEAAGFFRRVRDTTDRRRVLVEVTPVVRRVGELIWGPIAEDFRQLSTRYSTEQLELMLDFLRQGNARQEERQARLAELAPEVRKIARRARKK
jgi:DNA-binding MarR family transcriptional regulator